MKDIRKDYLNKISSIPLLSKEEERELLARAKNKDMGAIDKLVESNLKLVIPIANKYENRGVLYMDLIQEGNLGLLTAIEKFDLELEYRFSTYAIPWIRQYISRAIANQSKTIRIPVHIYEMITKIKKTESILNQELKRKPTTLELADAVGLQESQVSEYLEKAESLISIDYMVSDNEQDALIDIIENKDAEIPQEIVEKEELGRLIDKVLSGLEKRESDIIKMRFGLSGFKSMTLDEVGEALDLSRERVRQIEAKALTKMKHPSRMSILKEYL